MTDLEISLALFLIVILAFIYTYAVRPYMEHKAYLKRSAERMRIITRAQDLNFSKSQAYVFGRSMLRQLQKPIEVRQ